VHLAFAAPLEVAARGQRLAGLDLALVGGAVAFGDLFGEGLQPMPPIEESVPVKYRSTKSASRPTASKICAPV